MTVPSYRLTTSMPSAYCFYILILSHCFSFIFNAQSIQGIFFINLHKEACDASFSVDMDVWRDPATVENEKIKPKFNTNM